VSANKSPSNDSVPSRLGNADYRWAQFNSEDYFQHYYGQPHPDDERVIQCAVEAMKRALPIAAKLDVVDVGTAFIVAAGETFFIAMRLYWPKQAALDGTWKQPPMTKKP
jgi:hypothetical protein